MLLVAFNLKAWSVGLWHVAANKLETCSMDRLASLKCWICFAVARSVQCKVGQFGVGQICNLQLCQVTGSASGTVQCWSMVRLAGAADLQHFADLLYFQDSREMFWQSRPAVGSQHGQAAESVGFAQCIGAGQGLQICNILELPDLFLQILQDLQLEQV